MTKQHSVLLLIFLCIAPATVQAQALWEDWYLYNEHANLYVTEIGQGDTVVVLHGGWGAEHGYLLDAISGLEHQFQACGQASLFHDAST